MLFVRFFGEHRQGRLVDRLQVLLGQFGVGFAIVDPTLEETLTAKLANARSDQEIGNEAPFGEINEKIGERRKELE